MLMSDASLCRHPTNITSDIHTTNVDTTPAEECAMRGKSAAMLARVRCARCA